MPESYIVPLPNVRKIAVLRANALGDMIFALPALEALRATYPEAEIVLLGRAWHADFWQDRPGPVDRVEVLPPVQGITMGDDYQEDPEVIEAFFARMVRERFDLALQWHGGGRFSNPLVLRLGARLTAGLKTPDATPLDRWIPYLFYQREILRFLEVAALVGAEPVTIEPSLVVTQADLDAATAVVPPERAPLVILHPGATDSRRRWSAEKFAAVGDALAASGARIVVTGSPWEQEVLDRVKAAMQVPALHLGGRLSLSALVGVLAQAALVISNDTGPLHLAAAVGTPTVGLYWCGNMITAGPASSRLNRPLISWRLACPVCGQDCTTGHCPHRDSFVDDIRVEEVVGQAHDFLTLRATPGTGLPAEAPTTIRRTASAAAD